MNEGQALAWPFLFLTLANCYFSRDNIMGHAKNKIPSCDQCELCTFTVFKSVTTQDLAEVSDSKINLFIPKGQRIFSEGNMPNGLYALYSGKVKIHKNAISGSEQIIQLLAPGDVFGYKALLCAEPYGSSATAIEDSLVCLISQDVFNKILDKSHLFKKDIIFTLSDDLDFAQNRIELSNKPARERVLNALLSILTVYGMNEETGELNAKLPRKDLSSLAGLTLETTIRTLTALKGECIIDFEGKKIFIPNKAKFLNTTTVV